MAVLLSAVSALGLAHSTESARGAAPATWHLSFPRTISYRVLGQDWAIKCNQSDSVFDQEVAAEGLSDYEIYLVAGSPGTCSRLKAEQMKRLHPQKMVILYEEPNGGDPAQWPGGTWAGYYLFMNRTTAMSSVNATQTTVNVANPQFFSVGDTAAMWAPTPSDPYANSEWVTVTHISGSTLTVKRNIFNTGAKSYTAPPLIAAAATGATYPQPMYNLSDVAPVNPASGRNASQWLADTLTRDFAPSSAGAPTLDAMELDSTASIAKASNVNGSVKNLDCNDDGIIDYCERNIGTTQQVDSYGVGLDAFLKRLKAGLASYDTDPTRPHKMLLADGESGLRSLSSIDGAEFESYPTWDDYTYSSPALAALGVWHEAGTPGDRLSYAFTKDATPLYPQAGCVKPLQGGTCRNADFRYGIASALISGNAIAYNDESSFSVAEPWDEEATTDLATTRLGPGYLGWPIGPAVRTTRFTSGELAVNSSFESSLGSVHAAGAANGLSLTSDPTTAAPGWGQASLRADVTQLAAADPSECQTRAAVSLTSAVSPGEYTVDFWAKAQNTLVGPSALNMGARIDGAPGMAQDVLLTNSWRHFTLQMNATMSATKPVLAFCVGEEIGRYWIDGVSVHRGTAGIITRQYTNGIVVLNDSFSTQTNVSLPNGPYHHINGVQDRTVNDGSSVGSTLASIGSKDGEILLRG
jgi:hypothetical protein